VSHACTRAQAHGHAATQDFAPLVATAVGGGRDCGLAWIVVAKATITENRANKGTDNAVRGTDNAVKGTKKRVPRVQHEAESLIDRPSPEHVRRSALEHPGVPWSTLEYPGVP
jgi:hypothetical protein